MPVRAVLPSSSRFAAVVVVVASIASGCSDDPDRPANATAGPGEPGRVQLAEPASIAERDAGGPVTGSDPTARGWSP